MKLQIFAVFDSATAQYGTPMFLISAGQAVRSFSDEVNRRAPDNQLSTHAKDFSLHVLGSFDTESGLFETAPPSQVARGLDVQIKEH